MERAELYLQVALNIMVNGNAEIFMEWAAITIAMAIDIREPG